MSNKIKIIYLDTETTGTGLKDRILQNAYIDAVVNFKKKEIQVKKYLEEEITPPLPINPAAAAVHGLWYPDLENAPEWKDSKSKKALEQFIEEGYYICAHNSPFDIEMLEKEGIFWPEDRIIDTLKIARHVNKNNEEIESNGLQYLRYFYNFDMTPDFKEFIGVFGIEKLVPHTALSDIAVLAYYFKYLMQEGFIDSAEKAVEYTRSPIFEENITFGNIFEKGTPLKEVAVSSYEQYGRKKQGIDYLNWAITNMETMSADMKISISRIVIELVQEGKLSITNKSITPMKYIAATFVPSVKKYLDSIGFNTEVAKEKTLAKIKDTISELEKTGEQDKSAEYPNLLKLVKYAEFYKERGL